MYNKYKQLKILRRGAGNYDNLFEYSYLYTIVFSYFYLLNFDYLSSEIKI